VIVGGVIDVDDAPGCVGKAVGVVAGAGIVGLVCMGWLIGMTTAELFGVVRGGIWSAAKAPSAGGGVVSCFAIASNAKAERLKKPVSNATIIDK
jgi:hypothetical protein